MQVKVVQVDDRKNCDMIRLSDMRGIHHAIVHSDLFWGESSNRSQVLERLLHGEELVLDIAIAGEEAAEAAGEVPT